MRIVSFLITLLVLIVVAACVQPVSLPQSSNATVVPSGLETPPSQPPVSSAPVGSFFASYYNNTDFTQLVATRVESSIDHNWSYGAPLPGVGNDTFSVRWVGNVSFDAGTYTFTATSDDGERVWVDGQKIIDAWYDQGATAHTATIELSAGIHSVRMDYYEDQYKAVAKLSWASVETAPAPTPQPPSPTPVPPTSQAELLGPRPVASDPLSAGTRFASPSGSGSTCSQASPCSAETAMTGAGPGDHVFLEGGTYALTSSKVRLTNTGTKADPIVIESYPGERAVLDGGYATSMIAVYGNYYTIRNIDITRMTEVGLYIGGNHNTAEGVHTYANHLSGFQIYSPYTEYPYGAHGSYNTISDCISHDNIDVGLTWGNYANGGNADGISISSGEGNTITHCLVYNNSDDGMDTWRSTNSLVEYSITRNNGYGGGDGNGMKAGGMTPSDGTVVDHVLSYDNRATGFTYNTGAHVTFSYDTSYGNDNAFIWGSDSTVEHNIAANNNRQDNYGQPKLGTVTDNSWQRSGTVSFESTDPSSSNFLVPTSASGMTDIGAYAGSTTPTTSPPPAGSGSAPLGSFKASYYDNQDFTNLFATRIESSIDHNWSYGSPLPGMGNDTFSVRWVGNFSFDAGNYTFTATMDDGMRVWVDGQEIIDRWYDQSAAPHEATIQLDQGIHSIRVDYYEHQWHAVAELSWAKANATAPAPPPSNPPTGDVSTVSYNVDTTTTFANPDRGWYSQTSGPTTSWLNTQHSQGETVALYYVRLDNYRDRALPQSFLDSFSHNLSLARGTGIKYVIRFAYNHGRAPDAPLHVVLGQIKQVAPIINANKDVIASVQAGFIGYWAEMHDSTNYLDTPGNISTIVKAELNAFSPDLMVSVRTPYKAAYVFPDPVSKSDAFSGSPVSRLAEFNDCFLTGRDDSGTYDFWRSNAVGYAQRNFTAQASTYTPMGGETCDLGGLSTYNSCPNALAEMATMHWDYLHADYWTPMIDQWKSQGCFNEISNRLGYRLALTKATVPTSVSPGQTTSVSFTMQNTGFGKVYDPRPLELVFKSGSTTRTVTLTSDARTILPLAGETRTITRSFTVPSNLPAGTYELYLALPDPSSTLSGDPLYSIRLANVGTWDSSTGYNDLKAQAIVS